MTHRRPLSAPGEFPLNYSVASIERARASLDSHGGDPDRPAKLPKGITYHPEVKPLDTLMPDQDAVVPPIGKARKII